MTEPKREPKKPPGHADPDQFERFRKVAEEVEASDDPAEFDNAFDRLKIKTPPDGRVSSGPDSER